MRWSWPPHPVAKISMCMWISLFCHGAPLAQLLFPRAMQLTWSIFSRGTVLSWDPQWICNQEAGRVCAANSYSAGIWFHWLTCACVLVLQHSDVDNLLLNCYKNVLSGFCMPLLPHFSQKLQVSLQFTHNHFQLAINCNPNITKTSNGSGYLFAKVTAVVYMQIFLELGGKPYH